GRKRSSRATRAALLLGLPIGLALVTRLTLAAPLDEPFVGGMGFNGPTSGNIGAIYWNPAALGLVRGLQIMIAGTMRYTTTDVTRTPLDPTTGGSLPAVSA